MAEVKGVVPGGPFERALAREFADLRARFEAYASHAVAIQTGTCIYCGMTLAQLEDAEVVPHCRDVMAAKPPHAMTGLASIVGDSGPLVRANLDGTPER